jgi:GWxTD domain-containing protein
MAYARVASLITFFLLLITGPVFAQQPNGMQMDVDHASFAYDDTDSMVEMYLAFEAATLAYVPGEQGFVADVPVEVAVYKSAAGVVDGTPVDPVWEESVPLSFVVADTTGLVEGQHFLHQVRMLIEPGEYELRVSVPEDMASGRSSIELRRDMMIPDFNLTTSVAVSDFTLASIIAGSQDKDDLFYKNGLVIRPNANQLFGSGLNSVYYYSEVYGLNTIPSTSDKYSVFAYISEANTPQPLGDLQSRKVRDIRSPDVLVGSFDISKLASGSYFLRVAVLDEGNQAVAEQSKKFFVYNPFVERVAPVAMTDQSFDGSRYAALTDEEVELEQRLIEIVATPSERRRARSVSDPEEKRRAIMDFWLVRDPSPSSPINEYEESFRARVQYANDRYTSSYDEGWNTDRGRTLIKYGTPSNIEPHLYERDVKPYEVWEYNNIPGQGQAIFIFGDLNQFGLFELLHSTVTGERNNPTWLIDLKS